MELTDNDLRDFDRRKVRLSKKAKTEVQTAWQLWKTAPFNPYIQGQSTRAAYNETNRRGQNLIDVQTKHNVWLIHPDNAKAGFGPDDTRIVG